MQKLFWKRFVFTITAFVGGVSLCMVTSVADAGNRRAGPNGEDTVGVPLRSCRDVGVAACRVYVVTNTATSSLLEEILEGAPSEECADDVAEAISDFHDDGGGDLLGCINYWLSQ